MKIIKNTIALLLAAALCLALSGCGEKLPEPESSLMEPASEAAPESSSEPSPAPVPESEPVHTDEDALYRDAILKFGADVFVADDNSEQLRPDVSSLYYGNIWSTLSTPGKSYFNWYLSESLKEGLSPEERLAKYASPYGEGTGFFFPQEFFEPAVLKYFSGLSTEFLRALDIYDSEHEGYYLGGGGGIGETPSIILKSVSTPEGEPSLRVLHLSLQYQSYPERLQQLTLSLDDNGGYQFVSYIPEPVEGDPTQTYLMLADLKPYYMDVVAGRVEAYRAGNPPASNGEHQLWPEGYPSPSLLPEITAPDSYVLRQHGSADALDDLYVAVAIDADHEIRMSISLLRAADGSASWGSTNTWFCRRGDPKFEGWTFSEES